jgi:hypothetical protein
MSNHVLTNASPENLRALVEVIQYQTVAPRLLREEGWNTFDVRLTDSEVAEVISFARISPRKKLSFKHLARASAAIAAALAFRKLLAEGLVEECVGKDGSLVYRLTTNGHSYYASLDGTAA